MRLATTSGASGAAAFDATMLSCALLFTCTMWCRRGPRCCRHRGRKHTRCRSRSLADVGSRADLLSRGDRGAHRHQHRSVVDAACYLVLSQSPTSTCRLPRHHIGVGSIPFVLISLLLGLYARPDVSRPVERAHPAGGYRPRHSSSSTGSQTSPPHALAAWTTGRPAARRRIIYTSGSHCCPLGVATVWIVVAIQSRARHKRLRDN